jgi:2-succinyl-6-hydroxy-2,4-cyclohexadiene-1-carboxylate synthase
MSLLSVHRDGSGAPFAWLHGFTQTRTSAHEYRTILAGRHEVLTLDLPGHGEAHDVRANLDETANLVAEALGGPVALGGYSLGARVALHVALSHPHVVRRLVLLGATRGIADENDRAVRRARDEELARQIEIRGVDAFLDEWLAQPLFASLGDAAEPLTRSRNGAGLAASLRLAGTGTQSYLASRLHEISAPVLALAGERDEKFAGEALAIASAVRHGRATLIPGAGHAAHLEAPKECAAMVEEFLD